MVGWNVTAGHIVVQKPPIGQNYAIACKGTVDNRGPWVFDLGFVEGTGQANPDITSLYEAQLAERKTYGVGPDAPAKLNVTAATNGARLSWIDIAMDETSYVIERSSNNGDTYSVLTTVAANTVSYTDSSVGRGSYTYRVKAVNAIGSSAYGNPDPVTITNVSTSAISFIEPTQLTVKAGSSLYVNISATDSDGVDRVRLYKDGVELRRSEGQSPYEWNGGDKDAELQNLKSGSFVLTARATDLLGNVIETVPGLTITVRSGYTAWALTNEVVGQMSADDDKDGWTNLLEYATGGNGNVNGGDTRPTLVQAGSSFSYSYKKRNDDPDIIYVVETCSDLQKSEWVPLNSPVVVGSTSGNYDNVTQSIPANQGKVFVRLKVSLP
jgi:hypothetical protein